MLAFAWANVVDVLSDLCAETEAWTEADWNGNIGFLVSVRAAVAALRSRGHTSLSQLCNPNERSNTFALMHMRLYFHIFYCIFTIIIPAQIDPTGPSQT